MIAKARHIELPAVLLSHQELEEAPLPPFVFLAGTNGRCASYTLDVKEGDHVKIGDKLGMRKGPFFEQPIISTVSGTYLGIEKHLHHTGKTCDFLKIQNDFQDELSSLCHERSEEEIASLTKDDVLNIMKDMALVGLGGSSFPSYVKLQGDHDIHTIVINGVECEPSLASDHRLMLEHPHEIIEGVKYLMKAVGAKEGKICAKWIYKDLESTFSSALAGEEGSGVSYCQVYNFYPQGWEVACIKSATGIEVESGHLPAEYGVLEYNVATIYSLYLAIRYGTPLLERYVQIHGDGVVNPKFFKVRIGTPIQDLVALCGGYTDSGKKKRLIFGGPMMGNTVNSDDVICSPTVTSLLVLDEAPYKADPCVRCGSCVYSCPTHLMPVLIASAVKAGDKEKVKSLHPERCVECGLCAYACTSHINVTEFVRRAKRIAKL